jgi:hypothetical protein
MIATVSTKHNPTTTCKLMQTIAHTIPILGTNRRVLAWNQRLQGNPCHSSAAACHLMPAAIITPHTTASLVMALTSKSPQSSPLRHSLTLDRTNGPTAYLNLSLYIIGLTQTFKIAHSIYTYINSFYTPLSSWTQPGPPRR